MKTKNFNKKLTLNKTTVADLKQTEMNAVNGGADTTCSGRPECPPDPSWVSCEWCTLFTCTCN